MEQQRDKDTMKQLYELYKETRWTAVSNAISGADTSKLRNKVAVTGCNKSASRR